MDDDQAHLDCSETGETENVRLMSAPVSDYCPMRKMTIAHWRAEMSQPIPTTPVDAIRIVRQPGKKAAVVLDTRFGSPNQSAAHGELADNDEAGLV
jgi:hypothetical protein